MSDRETLIAQVQELDTAINNMKVSLEQAVMKRAELVGVIKYLNQQETLNQESGESHET